MRLAVAALLVLVPGVALGQGLPYPGQAGWGNSGVQSPNEYLYGGPLPTPNQYLGGQTYGAPSVYTPPPVYVPAPQPQRPASEFLNPGRRDWDRPFR